MVRRRALIYVGAGALVAAAFGSLIAIDAHRIAYREIRRTAYELHITYRESAVPCPGDATLILALGQSNGANRVADRVPAKGDLAALMFFRDHCYPIRDPVPGASGLEGSLWTLFAQRLTARTGNPVVVVAAAVDGSSVRDWRDEASGYARAAGQRLAEARRRIQGPAMVLWLQGETDAQERMTRATYRAHLEAVIAIVEAALGKSGADGNLAWVVPRETRCGSPASMSEDVRQAQSDVVRPERHIHAGPDLDQLGDAYRADRCHFNEAGRAGAVELLLESLPGLPEVNVAARRLRETGGSAK